MLEQIRALCAQVRNAQVRALLFVGVLMPLWSSYLIKAYTWRLITLQNGPLNWSLGKVGLGDTEAGEERAGVRLRSGISRGP